VIARDHRQAKKSTASANCAGVVTERSGICCAMASITTSGVAALASVLLGPGGRYLDAPQYDEVWSALESLDAPLYLHPGAPAGQWQVLQGRPELYGASWSMAAEVGGHALRIVYGGVVQEVIC
jgi:hypothetical protein